MTQEDKDLLLRDLCARLPYGVKGVEANTLCSLNTVTRFKSIVKNIEYKIEHLGFKPYLFPLSSMTEEQSMEFALLQVNTHKDGFLYVCDCANMMKWLLKNHFDIYGLIEKGLAIDATNLNIY